MPIPSEPSIGSNAEHWPGSDPVAAPDPIAPAAPTDPEVTEPRVESRGAVCACAVAPSRDEAARPATTAMPVVIRVLDYLALSTI